MITSGTHASNVQSLDSGYFQVGNAKLTFADLVMLIGKNSLKAQDKTFETMFKESQERTNCMNKLNDCIQMLNTYKDNFDKDGKAIDKGSYTGSSDELVGLSNADKEKWLSVYKPTLVDSGIIKDKESDQAANMGIGSDGIFTKKELDNFLENAKLGQSNMSSTNEQQMMKTNQAATKRSTVLQQLQTLLAAAKDASNAAAR